MAAKNELVCSQCGREFSMPAHLARHMNTMHRVKRGRGRPRGSTNKPKPVLATTDLGDRRLVEVLRAAETDLITRRAGIDHQLAAVSAALIALEASPTYKRGRGRPRGSKGRGPKGVLSDLIIQVLRASGKPMGPREIAEAVDKAGYQTNSKDLSRVISNTLPRVAGLKKAGFGQYHM